MRLRKLPDLTASGAVQMAVDDGLMSDALWVTARRYRWSPPTLSLGKFQQLPGAAADPGLLGVAGAAADPGLPGAAGAAGEPGSTPSAGGLDAGRPADPRPPFDVVRRPSGGRAVLHGVDFEWSFAVAFPAGSAGNGNGRVDTAYTLVSGAMADALEAAGVTLSDEREEPYRRSALCFATSLRHDLHAAVGKVVAVAQVRRDGATLVHGSVLERRPPAALTDAVERLVGEPWRGRGLSALATVDGPSTDDDAGATRGSPMEQSCIDADALWVWFLESLGGRLA